MPSFLDQQSRWLQQLAAHAHGLVPHLERLLCFQQLSASCFRLLFDSRPETPVPGLDGPLWRDPVAELQRQGSRTLFSHTLADHQIVCVAEQGAHFLPAEQAALIALAELVITNLPRAGDPLAALRLTTAVAHDFMHLRDGETGHHLERVSCITRLIADGLAQSHGLSAAFIEAISMFSRLHDIGKIGIPDEILLKPGRLTPEERQVMDTHVPLGLEILQKLLAQYNIPDQPTTRLMANIIGTHHERLDGSGYPHGLRGEAIPLEGRIVAVADVFDALTSTRPYRRSASVSEGLARVQQLAEAGELDPACVAALQSQQQALQSLVDTYPDVPVERGYCSGLGPSSSRRRG